MPSYVLIEVDEFIEDAWAEEEQNAESLAGYVRNELENDRIIKGRVRGFESLEDLSKHVQRIGRGVRK